MIPSKIVSYTTVFRPGDEEPFQVELSEDIGNGTGQTWALRGTINDRPAVAYFRFEREEAGGVQPVDLPFDVQHLSRID